MTIEIDGIEFLVSYSYEPAVPGRWYMNNGDPGYPDEPETVEDIRLTAVFDGHLNGQVFELDYDKLPRSVQYRIYNEICEFEGERRRDDNNRR